MCRQNKWISALLIGVGAGLLLALLLPGPFLTFLLAAISLAVGIILLNR